MGTFTTTYKFESKWDPDAVSGVELHGRCQHPIAKGSGTGDLRVPLADSISRTSSTSVSSSTEAISASANTAANVGTRVPGRQARARGTRSAPPTPTRASTCSLHGLGPEDRDPSEDGPLYAQLTRGRSLCQRRDCLLCLYRGSMVDVEYWHVDVFSRYAFQGNGLVVVRDDIGLSTAVQQQLTREVRQFETVFISGVDLLGRTARLRIFTEDEELGFAGHPMLGVGAVLHSELSAAAAEETWALELSSRIVSVLTRGRDGWIEASMDQGPARFGMNVTGELTDRYRRALGLSLAAVRADLPMQVVSTGLPYLIVPVHAQGLATAHIATPDFEAILAASGAKFVYVLDPATPEGRTWDNTGRIEDVATGSAAGPAAAYLIEHRAY